MQVIVGPTPIVNGDAKAAGDITVVNEKLAFALAVQSAVPYGVPRGALIDLAPVTDGKIGRDRVVFADFIPNHWSAWPNTYQHIEILERGPDRAILRTTRDWGKVTIATVYTLASNSDRVEIQTTMTNAGDALPGLLSGLTLWPNSGFLFGVPGLQGIAESEAGAALADRVVAYDEDWVIALHAPYFDHVGDESMDMYLLHTLGAGASRTFEGWLQVGASGDLAPVLRAEIERRHLAAGGVHGMVTGRGTAIERPVVVVEKRGKPYAWVLGHGGEYRLTLPPGDYALYATARNYSQTRRINVKIEPGSDLIRDFRDLESSGRVRFAIVDSRTGKPVDARIAITEGQKQTVEFLSRKTFFTELDRRGSLDIPMAPGRYVLTVSSGGGFFGPSREVRVVVAADSSQTVNVALTRLFDPAARGWYCADLHHHADQAEAVTPPADLARSQLAAGLDLLFVSDHDSTANHGALQEIADRRGVPFIPAVELSPSWGHFNAYPWSLGRKLTVDTGVASVGEILAEARRQGAIVVQANHPFIPYGYLTSVAAGVAPGGFNPAFDLLEINDSAPDDDDKVVRALWEFWNAGHRYYLTAGTDTHDVWKSESGHVRAFAHVDGPVSGRAFTEALREGHGYVTRGPLVFPSVMFGEERRVKSGEPFDLTFDLESVGGLKRVALIGAGAEVAGQSFASAPQEARIDFPLTTRRSTWYSLMAEDVQGHKAYTDPIWIDVVSYPKDGLPPDTPGLPPETLR
ncbi:MAG: hypothetical protein JWN43_1847 [Gammaproteobacteria bacterium]|nr:hypothetical protein [Gammaproteobacteria bacterium]